MTTEECFEAAVQVENLMRDVYVRLAGRYDAEAKLKEVFLRLAEEEEQHAHRIRLLARTQLGGAWASATADRISRDLSSMSADLLKMVEDLEAEWDGGAARDVLRRVMVAEDRCASIHAEELASSAEIDVQMLFWSLSKQDVRHKELLERAIVSA
jgi:rubrerythrin